jgi:hypothetical protein
LRDKDASKESYLAGLALHETLAKVALTKEVQENHNTAMILAETYYKHPLGY